jgi:hypothetical protein
MSNAGLVVRSAKRTTVLVWGILMSGERPTTHQGNLAKLPPALTPLIERPQWAVWRWEPVKGKWTKPPFQSRNPRLHASTDDPGTWSSYAEALACVQAGDAEGVTFIMTENDPLAAIDLDHCRDLSTTSYDTWAQNFLDVAKGAYTEITPSGQGVRIWGLTADTTGKIHRQINFKFDGKKVGAEFFLHTAKALTVTGLQLGKTRELINLDHTIKWGIVACERRKSATMEAAAAERINGHDFNAGGPGHDVAYIEQLVREGAPPGGNRSDMFHTVVGHYLGCGWSPERIQEHLRQFPEGIAGRYIAEERLAAEVVRSAKKYAASQLPVPDLFNRVEAKAPQPEAPANPPADEDAPSPELEEPAPEQAPADDDVDVNDDDNLEDDAELEDDEDDLEEDDGPQTKLPEYYRQGEPDARPAQAWLIKGLVPIVGHGLLAGQWGAGKTFILLDMAMMVCTGQPFLGAEIKRQCGVLLIAAEGANQVRTRLDAVVHHKCADQKLPFGWYEMSPVLLKQGAVEMLIAMARQADHDMRRRFGVPLGLIIVDTIPAAAGYSRSGDEQDSSATQAVHNVLRALAQETDAFVLGVDHYGKSLESGVRGSSSKEGASDLVLACLGDRSMSGAVSNTRLAVRKNRAGKQGQEFPFGLREVEGPGHDEDGNPIKSMVVDWTVPASSASPTQDPWETVRREDQRTAVMRLKRALMATLAELGVELPIPPDGPVVRMIKQEDVRKAFYALTPAEGTPAQKAKQRRQKFIRALDWAEAKGVIAIHEIGEDSFLHLCSFRSDEDEEE